MTKQKYSVHLTLETERYSADSLMQSLVNYIGTTEVDFGFTVTSLSMNARHDEYYPMPVPAAEAACVQVVEDEG